MSWVLPPDENKNQDKRVESISVPCLDAGSTPASSTACSGGYKIHRGLKLVLKPEKRSIARRRNRAVEPRVTRSANASGGISSVGRAQRSQC